jgi:predicted AlkP superfamily phosphohydrolase/phosphomutase
VDWSRTRAWGAGGYYGRVFLNVQGREPQGVIAPEDYEHVRDELGGKLKALPDPRGNPLATSIYKPDQIYRECNGIPPDLIVHFGNLSWRCSASLGHNNIYSFDSDGGPDDANHSQHGIFIAYDPRRRMGRKVEGLHVMDMAPTILSLFGLPVPADMQGKVIQLT